jgi:hypothetical protein
MTILANVEAYRPTGDNPVPDTYMPFLSEWQVDYQPDCRLGVGSNGRHFIVVLNVLAIAAMTSPTSLRFSSSSIRYKYFTNLVAILVLDPEAAGSTMFGPQQLPVHLVCQNGWGSRTSSS